MAMKQETWLKRYGEQWERVRSLRLYHDNHYKCFLKTLQVARNDEAQGGKAVDIKAILDKVMSNERASIVSAKEIISPKRKDKYRDDDGKIIPF